MSYRLGANEGWIALKRNHFAFSIFEQLPPDLAEDALNEFARLLESGFYDQAAEIFIGPASHVRDRILARLTGVRQRDRDFFERALNRRDYDIAIPGAEKG
jgi:hypothetical protein